MERQQGGVFCGVSVRKIESDLMSCPLAPQVRSSRAPRVVKVDCEGCEYGVLLEWASSGFLARVRLLSAETHARYATAGTYSAQAMEKLDAALLARGCRRPPRPGKKPWQLEFDFPC